MRLTKIKKSSRINNDIWYIRSERDKIFGDWIYSNDEAKSMLIEFYYLIKNVDFEIKPYFAPLDYSSYIYHLGMAKKFFMKKDYISAACELKDERYINLELPGAKENIIQLIETELLNDAVKKEI